MSVETPPRTPSASAPALGAAPLVNPPLPRWAPLAALISGAALSAAVTFLLGDFSIVLFVLLAVIFTTAIITTASRVKEGGRKALDRFVTCVVISAFGLAMVPLVSLVIEVVGRGIKRLDAEFFSSSMVGIVGEGGGAYHAILGTLIITLITTLISVPIGLMTAIYLVEYGHGRLARSITFLVDVMTGIPSIVAGLFAYALFVLFFGPGVRLGIAGAVALSVLMIPVVVRSAEEILKLVPNELREAAYALGVPKWRTIVKIVLPTSAAGLATGVTLAISRVIGETAPLLVTVGATNGTNLNPFDGRMATLPVYSFYSYTQPGIPAEFSIDRAWTAALVLIALVMVLNLIARLISRRFSPKTGR